VRNTSEDSIVFSKRFSVALQGEQPGNVSGVSRNKLGPYEALEIDCEDILRHNRIPECCFLKGFAVIESEVELDITVVYTAAKSDDAVETMDVETVKPRIVKKKGRVPQPPERPELPDLVPVPDPRPGVGFCRLDDQGRLLVAVKNQGIADAPASTTTVQFTPGGSFDLPTPAIPAGGTVDLPPLPIPPSCFNPDCNFRIIADSKGQVVESDEGNNVASGTCIG
jgi:hypothetical protein